MQVRTLPCGERAVLLEVDTLADVMVLTDALAGLPGALDIVPAARTILLVADATDLAAVTSAAVRLATSLPDASGLPEPHTLVTIPVHYDGPDLDLVASHTGLTTAEVVAAHTGRPWRVAFGGFAPGFAYLTDGDPRLRVGRRTSPRTRVPAGSVALADEFTGVYPSDSPGGWQLIGHTDARLWDVDRKPAALLRPGTQVSFEAR